MLCFITVAYSRAFFFFAVLPIAEVEQEKVDVLQRLFRGWFEMDGLLDVRF